jgi:hypothetical protein
VKAIASCVVITAALSIVCFGASLPVNTDIIQKSVVFLYYMKDGGVPEAATGFMIAIPLKGGQQVQWAILTARHVVDPQWAHCSWRNPQTITIRMNTPNYKATDGQSGVWEKTVPLVENGTWVRHIDDKVDAALIPVQNPDEMKAHSDVIPISLVDFGTAEEIEKFKIGVGDGIISAGLVPELLDANRNYPAFKFGKVSNVMTEPIRLHCDGAPREMLNWIVGGNFVPGNSGSPSSCSPWSSPLGPTFSTTGPGQCCWGC